MKTRSYFPRFIFSTSTAPKPSSAVSIVHPKTFNNLPLNIRYTTSSSTKSTRGGLDQRGLENFAAPFGGFLMWRDEHAGLAAEDACELQEAMGRSCCAYGLLMLGIVEQTGG